MTELPLFRYGGKPCPDEEEGYCGTDYCAVNCVYEWGDW